MSENQLAQKVKGLRKSKGFSQEALATISGLSLRTVQRIENENKNPSGDSLKRLSTALGVSPDYLLDWEPNDNPNFLLILAFSPILCIIHPFLAIIVPLILWSIKKNQIRGVKQLGVKIITIQTIWLVVFYLLRTLNFLRLQHKIDHTFYAFDEQWNRLILDVNTQYYLKVFFYAANILIILFIAFKTYQHNKSNKSFIYH